MSLEAQQALLFSILPLAYIFAGVWLLMKGRVLAAGFSTLAIALIPILWLFLLPIEEIDAPGTRLLVMVLIVPICLSFFVSLIGLGIAVLRFFRPYGSPPSPPGAEV